VGAAVRAGVGAAGLGARAREAAGPVGMAL
jgi:hypothetical protein